MMRKRHFCLILMVAILPIAAHANHYTINHYTITFTGTGFVPSSGSFDYTTTTGFSNFLVYWPAILGTTPFDLTSAANNPIGGGCGTATAALAFGLLEHSLTGCGAGTYQWSAVSIREGGQTLDFSYGPTGTSYAIDIPGAAYCSTCAASVGNFGSWTVSPGVGRGKHNHGAVQAPLESPVPEPSTLGLLGIGLLSGIGTLRRKLLL
jgi:hypothetical protein